VVTNRVLGPVATLLTNRTATCCVTQRGPLVELTDDLVSSSTPGTSQAGSRDRGRRQAAAVRVIEDVGNLLRTSGAFGGEFVPRVVRALGPQASAEPDPPLRERWP